MTYRDPRDEQIERLRAELAEANAALIVKRAPSRSHTREAAPGIQFSPLRPFRQLSRAWFRTAAGIALRGFDDYDCNATIITAMLCWILTLSGIVSIPATLEWGPIGLLFLLGTLAFPLRAYVRRALHLDEDTAYKRFVQWCEGRA